MTNFERIKAMNEEDLAIYIQSAFFAGRLYERHSLNTEEQTEVQMSDMVQWLKAEAAD